MVDENDYEGDLIFDFLDWLEAYAGDDPIEWRSRSQKNELIELYFQARAREGLS